MTWERNHSSLIIFGRSKVNPRTYEISMTTEGGFIPDGFAALGRLRAVGFGRFILKDFGVTNQTFTAECIIFYSRIACV